MGPPVYTARWQLVFFFPDCSVLTADDVNSVINKTTAIIHSLPNGSYSIVGTEKPIPSLVERDKWRFLQS